MVTDTLKLYHYVHCPFCVRVRMALGFLNEKFESIVLPYDDEETPIKLNGKKMLPLAVFSNGDKMYESLDIIQKIDKNNRLKFEKYLDYKKDIDDLISAIGKDVHCLCMPYWIWTAEFDESSRKYFQEKKEKTKGPFKDLILNKKHYLQSLDGTLQAIEKKLSPFYGSDQFSICDIMIASHLWGMYIFPEFQFSPQMHQYLQKVKSLSQFEYHKDFWTK